MITPHVSSCLFHDVMSLASAHKQSLVSLLWDFPHFVIDLHLLHRWLQLMCTHWANEQHQHSVSEDFVFQCLHRLTVKITTHNSCFTPTLTSSAAPGPGIFFSFLPGMRSPSFSFSHSVHPNDDALIMMHTSRAFHMMNSQPGKDDDGDPLQRFVSASLFFWKKFFLLHQMSERFVFKDFPAIFVSKHPPSLVHSTYVAALIIGHRKLRLKQRIGVTAEKKKQIHRHYL